MKIVTGMLGILVILTLVYFAQIWRDLPSVGPNVAALVPQDQSVHIGLSSAETPTPSPSPVRK